MFPKSSQNGRLKNLLRTFFPFGVVWITRERENVFGLEHKKTGEA